MDTLTIIKNKIKDLDSLYKRMDKTRDFVYNEPYKMKKLDGKTLEDRVINVTMPYAPIIANTIINDLMEAHWAPVVDGNISSTQKNYIERFIRNNGEETDELLGKKGFPPLQEWWCNHVCIRSYIGVRYVSQMINGQFIIDALPVDMRYTPFEHGNDGLNWIANISYYSESQVRAEFEEELKTKGANTLRSSQTDIEVKDYWNGEINEVYIGDTKVREQKNPFGYPPFIIAAPATGFMLRDKGYIEHESEDILFLIRDVLNEINRSVSLEQTLGYEVLKPPYVKPEEIVDGQPAEAPPKTAQTKKAKKGYEWVLLDKPDVNRAFITGREDLAKVLQMGGVNDIDLGNVSQTVSAVWITAQAGIRKKFSNPRLKTIGQAKQMLDRMRIDQAQRTKDVEKGSPEMVIGRRGQKVNYSPDKLGDPENYDIRYEYRTQSATEEIANLTQFEAAPDLPYEWRLEHILKADNPQAIIRMRDMERAKEDELVFNIEMGLSHAKEAEAAEDEQEAQIKSIEAKAFIDKAVKLLNQIELPATTAVGKEQTKGNPQLLAGLPKLLSSGGGAVRQRQEVQQ